MIGHYPCLVLNADFRPLSVAPLSKITWERAVHKVMSGRVIQLESYNRVIRSRGSEIQEPVEIVFPSVIALKEYDNQNRPAPFNRAGIFLRDRNRCGYCQGTFASNELTFDHVIPRARGGKTSWTNIVSACTKCNGAKGSKLLSEAKMHLHCDPVVPTCAHLNKIAMEDRKFINQALHKTWLPYLGLEDEDMKRIAKVTVGPVSPLCVFPDNMTAEDYWFSPLSTDA